MRLTSILLYKVHNIPYRFRGKHGKIKKPTFKDIILFKQDIEREEQNMLLLRHPYLTSEQTHGHMKEVTLQKRIDFITEKREALNQKFNKEITIADRLNHLKVREAWD
ncbi:uncharacterized protein LOC114875297 [Osmia bicornis bicornis]|uniref:uncharacterized protein LOC114875297 n=1 Tax=Osmia bicornis bicornis TaxID=1437191 RepID=UPI0010F52BE6|nr:uncharacterized protein LOC114875297 [Osmia bicornis bicornis]